MKNFLTVFTLLLFFNIYSQWINGTGIRISEATNFIPTPGIKYIGSNDNDAFLYNNLFFNNYGIGFYNKSNGDVYNNIEVDI